MGNDTDTNQYVGIFAMPLAAAKLMFADKMLVFIAFLPGLGTMALTCVSVWGIWQVKLIDISLWYSVPITIILFPALWIIFGLFALMPFEDTIIDKVQMAVWKEVRVPAPEFQAGRVMRQTVYSLSVTVIFLILLVIAAIPGVAIVSYVAASWLTAWGFLSAFYARSDTKVTVNLRRFFRNVAGNTLLGMLLNFLLFVPIVNVFVLGYALVLSTRIEIERLSKNTSTI